MIMHLSHSKRAHISVWDAHSHLHSCVWRKTIQQRTGSHIFSLCRILVAPLQYVLKFQASCLHAGKCPAQGESPYHSCCRDCTPARGRCGRTEQRQIVRVIWSWSPEFRKGQIIAWRADFEHLSENLGMRKAENDLAESQVRKAVRADACKSID